MRTVALIPLRGGSKSIINKNIKYLGGKPLCAWVIEAATSASQIDQVYVSTDSDIIAETVANLDLKVKVIKRPDELATDEASTESVMLHFLDLIDFDNLVTIQATSPMLTNNCLDKALDKFNKSKADSLFTSVRVKRFFWDENIRPINYNYSKRPRRQDFNGTIMENGAFYITKRSLLKDLKCRLGGEIICFEMSEENSIELDEPSDWPMLESLIKRRKRGV